MKWLVSSDIHISPKSSEAYRWLVFDEMHEVLDKDPGVSAVILCGDYTDFKDCHTSALVNKLSTEIRSLAQRKPVYMLGGNHDTVNEVGFHFFSYLDNYDNVSFISTPLALKIDDKRVLFLPHARNPHDTWKDIDFTKFDFIFMHQTVIGAKTSDSFVMSSGLHTDIFKGATAQIFSGDIHVPQKVGPVTYIGAPLRLRYGDSYTPRMLIMRENGYDTYTMTHLPMKHKVLIKDPSDLENVAIKKGDMVRVTCVMNELAFSSFSEFKSDITKHLDDVGAITAAIDLKRKHRVRLIDKKSVVKTGSVETIVESYARKESLGQGVLSTALEIVRGGIGA